MKILKAILLIFIISFTVNNANAQRASVSSSLSGCNMSMDITHITSPAGLACMEIELFNASSSEILLIGPEGRFPSTSEIPTSNFTINVCVDRPTVSTNFTIECGSRTTQGTELCRDQVVTVIEP